MIDDVFILFDRHAVLYGKLMTDFFSLSSSLSLRLFLDL